MQAIGGVACPLCIRSVSRGLEEATKPGTLVVIAAPCAVPFLFEFIPEISLNTDRSPSSVPVLLSNCSRWARLTWAVGIGAA